MNSYWGLFWRFIVRDLTNQKLRSLVTVLGISLGVASMIAVRVANASALESFRTATERLAGETSIQISGQAGPFDELMLRELDWLREYGQLSPVILGQALFDNQTSKSYPASSRGQFLQVLGVDILRDRPLRDYRLLRFNGGADSQPSTRDFLLLLSDPTSIVLTERFAGTNGLSIGSSVTLVIGDGRKEFKVRGLLRDEGVARSFQGNIALLDIAAAQVAFDRLGLLDRIDVKLRAGTSLETAERDIASRLPAALVVNRPDSTYGQVEKMIAAFHLNLTALGSIALLVGLFLIYNTISISVITRRNEIGSLRAVGASRRTILALFLGKAFLLSLVGAALGVVVGRVLANAAVRATATTVETFYIASAATEALEESGLGMEQIILAFVVGSRTRLDCGGRSIARSCPRSCCRSDSRNQPVSSTGATSIQISRAFRTPVSYRVRFCEAGSDRWTSDIWVRSGVGSDVRSRFSDACRTLALLCDDGSDVEENAEIFAALNQACRSKSWRRYRAGVDLGGSPRNEPGNDGCRIGDDLQLSGHCHLLGGPVTRSGYLCKTDSKKLNSTGGGNCSGADKDDQRAPGG